MYHLELNGNLMINVCKDAVHCAMFYNFRESIQYCLDRAIRENEFPVQLEISEGVLNYAKNADDVLKL